MSDTDERIAVALLAPYHRVFIRDESGAFTALVLEWPGCLSEGDSLDEANSSLEDAMAGWAAAMLEDGKPLPEPIATEYSGKVLLRMPHQTHRLLALRAAEEEISMNTLIISYVEAGLVR